MNDDNPFANLTGDGDATPKKSPPDKAAPKPKPAVPTAQPAPKARPTVPTAQPAPKAKAPAPAEKKEDAAPFDFASLQFGTTEPQPPAKGNEELPDLFALHLAVNEASPQPPRVGKETPKAKSKDEAKGTGIRQHIGWIIAALVVVVLLFGSLWWYVKGSKPAPATAKTEETAKVDPVKAELPKVEAPKATPKVEPPKAAPPKVELPKVTLPKVEAPKAPPVVVTPPPPAKRQVPKGLSLDGETDVTEAWEAKISAEHVFHLPKGGKVTLSPYARFNKGYEKGDALILQFYITEGDQKIELEDVVGTVNVTSMAFNQPFKIVPVTGSKTVHFQHRVLLVLTIRQ